MWKELSFYLLCRNLLVLFCKRAKSTTKVLCLSSTFNFNLPRECSELVYVSWSTFFLNREQFQIELLLVGLFEERHEETRSFEYLRSEDRIEESLVIWLSFDQLARSESVCFWSGQWWNDNLRVRAQKIVSQDGEISVQSFDAPLHRESVNGDHLALLPHVASQLRNDILVDARNNAHWARVSRQGRIFGNWGVSAAQHWTGSSTLHSFVEKLRGWCIQHTAASAWLRDMRKK